MILPIDPSLWFLFFVVFASTGIVPGPNVAYSVAQSLSFGFRRAMPVALGFAIGTGGHAVVVFSGIGLLAERFDFVLTAIKWVGIAFLIYLAIKAFMAKGETRAVDAEAVSARDLVWGAILVSFTNPKGVIASILIYPVFVNETLPFLPQAVILGLTGMACSLVIYAGYIFIAGQARVLFKNQVSISRLAGVIYIGVAAALALS
ncbi:MAG: LysE family transporter [Alphaproteobacteria bacterium]|jgi:threonine/homoserine/homoserine lactone efflux protein|nr:LysE family transporter [Alphaproteobacteria bacterium]